MLHCQTIITQKQETLSSLEMSFGYPNSSLSVNAHQSRFNPDRLNPHSIGGLEFGSQPEVD